MLVNNPISKSLDTTLSFNNIDPNSCVSNDKIAQRRVVEKLLSPRFLMFEPYPHTEFKRGQIISPVSHVKITHYREFPANFRELKWHEERGEEELPDYVKSKKLGVIVKLISKAIFDSQVTIQDHTGSACLMFIDDLHPAPEFEYIAYVESKKAKW